MIPIETENKKQRSQNDRLSISIGPNGGEPSSKVPSDTNVTKSDSTKKNLKSLSSENLRNRLLINSETYKDALVSLEKNLVEALKKSSFKGMKEVLEGANLTEQQKIDVTLIATMAVSEEYIDAIYSALKTKESETTLQINTENLKNLIKDCMSAGSDLLQIVHRCMLEPSSSESITSQANARAMYLATNISTKELRDLKLSEHKVEDFVDYFIENDAINDSESTRSLCIAMQNAYREHPKTLPLASKVKYIEVTDQESTNFLIANI